MLGRYTHLSNTHLRSDLAHSRATLCTCHSSQRARLTISARGAGRSGKQRVLSRELATERKCGDAPHGPGKCAARELTQYRWTVNYILRKIARGSVPGVGVENRRAAKA
jgi:hypothetical protein